MTSAHRVATADRYDAIPADPNGTAVLLLAGSSGRIERERAELLARPGARARAIRWFGGEGQRPHPHEVPLELFTTQIEQLPSGSRGLSPEHPTLTCPDDASTGNLRRADSAPTAHHLRNCRR